MKKIILILLFAMPGILLFAQDAHHQAPDGVRQSFHRDYPEANDARWSQSHGQWSADFNDRSATDRGEMTAHYGRDGRHIDSHVPYDRQDVPPIVVSRAERRYRGGHHYRYTRIEQPNGDGFFRISVNLHGRDRTTYLDERGQERRYEDRH